MARPSTARPLVHEHQKLPPLSVCLLIALGINVFVMPVNQQAFVAFDVRHVKSKPLAMSACVSSRKSCLSQNTSVSCSEPGMCVNAQRCPTPYEDGQPLNRRQPHLCQLQTWSS